MLRILFHVFAVATTSSPLAAVPSAASGLVTVLNTPFDDAGMLDVQSLGRNVEYALRSKVDGFLVPAMAAEVNSLTESERFEMVSIVVNQTRSSNKPVVCGIYADDEATRLRYLGEWLSRGCKGILLNIAYSGNDTIYAEAVHRVAQEIPTGAAYLQLQDWNATGTGLPLSLLVDLWKSLPVLRSVKIETVNAAMKSSQLLHATNHQINVASGWAVTHMIEALERGVETHMPTGMHELYAAVIHLYSVNKTEATCLHQQLLPILSFSNTNLDTSIIFFKKLLHKQGIYQTARTRLSPESEQLVWDSFSEQTADYLTRYTVDLISAWTALKPCACCVQFSPLPQLATETFTGSTLKV